MDFKEDKCRNKVRKIHDSVSRMMVESTIVLRKHGLAIKWNEFPINYILKPFSVCHKKRDSAIETQNHDQRIEIQPTLPVFVTFDDILCTSIFDLDFCILFKHGPFWDINEEYPLIWRFLNCMSQNTQIVIHIPSCICSKFMVKRQFSVINALKSRDII